MKLLICHRLSDAEKSELSSLAGDHTVSVVENGDRVPTEITDADAYVPGPWSEDVFRSAERLRWVHFLWAGVDRALFPAVVESDVTVTNSAGAFSAPMAEHAVALMLAFSRGLNVSLRQPGDWRGVRRKLWDNLPELAGATVGILGYGGIGQETGRKAHALGMRVLALRTRAQEPDGVAEVIWGEDRLDDLLRHSDYLVIACPLNDRTRGLLGEREFDLMKPTAVVVNLARGAVIDQEALIEALRSGKIGGAGLDVTTPEPLPPDSELWEMENAIVTPHMSGTSPHVWDYQWRILRDNVERYFSGRPLLNVVDKQQGY